jgi:hypothetical protein
MHIGEISNGSGISTLCIRYYEKHGVIPKAVRGKMIIESIQTRISSMHESVGRGTCSRAVLRRWPWTNHI